MKKKKESFYTTIKNWTISLLLAAVLFVGVQGYSQSSLKFVQLSDIHYYTGTDNTTFKLIGESPKLLDDAVEQINELPNVSFVMVTGDLIDKAWEKELLAFLPHIQKLNYPWYFTFGNHDTNVGGYLTTGVFIDDVKKSNPDFKFDRSYYTFVPQKGFRAIVLDPIVRDRITANGQLPAEQLEWLDEQIKKSPKDIILIFMHNPIIEPFSSQNHRLLNAGEVDKILHKYPNPTAVFTGHYHASKIVQNGNVLYVDSPALVSYPLAFRVINVTTRRDKVIFNIQWKETRLQNLQKLAKLMVFGTSIYTGEEKDREGVFEINKVNK
jgi:3',5'-cyclic AMP phosphodiesterase CpdA